MTAITHILYDLGNTLIYFDGQWPDVFSRACSALGAAAEALLLPVEGARLADLFRMEMEQYYELREESLIERTTTDVLTEVLAGLGISKPAPPTLESVLSAFYAITQAHWQPDHAAQAILAELHQQGFAQAVLSNAAYDRDVQELVDKAALRPSLDFVLSSATIGFRKPHLNAFRAALSRWQVAPEHVLMVGDTLQADILGAARFGLQSVWVLEHAQPVAVKEETLIRPDYTIDRITDLPILLGKT